MSEFPKGLALSHFLGGPVKKTTLYDGEIVLESREGHSDFMDALATLQVEVTQFETRIDLWLFPGGADCGPKSQTKRDGRR